MARQCARDVRSPPLESKESEAEPLPVAWISPSGLLFNSTKEASGEPLLWHEELKPLYTTPQPCPKCAEHMKDLDGMAKRFKSAIEKAAEWNAARYEQTRRAEAAEKHAAEETMRCLDAEEKIKNYLLKMEHLQDL